MTEEQMEVVRLHMRDTYDVAPWEWDSGELELAIYELITKNQAKNNEVLDLVSKRVLPAWVRPAIMVVGMLAIISFAFNV